MKPTILVGQKASDTILSVQLYLRVQSYGENDWYMGAYPITGAWDESTVTWNNLLPSTNISEGMLSYHQSPGQYNWGYFDVTEAYKSWYNTANGTPTAHGIALRNPGVGVYKYCTYYSTHATVSRPYFVVNYVSHAGRAPWWKYEGMSVGRAGSAFADIYNGNLEG